MKTSLCVFLWAYRLAVVPDDLQEAGLQQRVDPLTGPQVFLLVGAFQAEQQSPCQHQEGRSGGHERALQSLHRQRQLLQLRGNKVQLFVRSGGSKECGGRGLTPRQTLTASSLAACCMSARFLVSVAMRRSLARATKSGLLLNLVSLSSSEGRRHVETL